MIKLRVLSDLHLEFGPIDLAPIGEDVLVLAGDIGTYTDGADWAVEYANQHQIPVVMIAGNHEFYRVKWGARKERPLDHTVDSTITALRGIAEHEPLFHFLEDDIVAEVAGVLFVGCTLWTDFNLNGNPTAAMWRASRAINDYNLIKEDQYAFAPEDALRRHEFSVGILRERLPRRYLDDRPIVVVTHHLPSAKSIAGRYATSIYNAAYASNLDDLVEGSGAAVWIHGHTHVSQDYRIGETRIICNPRGYVGYETNPDFDPDLIVEV